MIDERVTPSREGIAWPVGEIVCDTRDWSVVGQMLAARWPHVPSSACVWGPSIASSQRVMLPQRHPLDGMAARDTDAI